MIIIGLTGEKRGGKGTLTELLSNSLPDKKIIRMGFGDIVGDLLDILGKERSREEMQKLPIILMNGYREPDVVTMAMKKRIGKIKNSEAGIIVLDGIRTWQDLEMLRSFPENLLVYVTASLETRYRRAKASNEKVGDKSLTFEQFKAQDEAEIERLIPEIGVTADFIIQNESTLDEYRRKAEIFIKYKIPAAE